MTDAPPEATQTRADGLNTPVRICDWVKPAPPPVATVEDFRGILVQLPSGELRRVVGLGDRT